MVPLRTPTLPPATHTNCLLLGDEELWVVDPGSPWPEEQAILRETLDKLAEEGRRAAGVLLTHHHLDHTGGARALGLPIAATRETAAKLDFPVDRTVEDGERFEVGPRGWRALAPARPHARAPLPDGRRQRRRGRGRPGRGSGHR